MTRAVDKPTNPELVRGAQGSLGVRPPKAFRSGQEAERWLNEHCYEGATMTDIGAYRDAILVGLQEVKKNLAAVNDLKGSL